MSLIRLRCCRRLFVMFSVIVLFVLLLVAISIFQLKPLITKWQLTAMAGTDRKLLTFRSTVNWGIGNAMFAFASTIGVSLHSANNVWLVCFDSILPLREIFEPLNDWSQCRSHDVISVLPSRTYIEGSFAKYDDRIAQKLVRDRHVVLDRFLQSWKYFAGFESEIRQLFRFTESINRKAEHALSQAVRQIYRECSDFRCNGTVVTVGVHIRRGDMATDATLHERGYVTANVSYLDRAMSHFDQKFQSIWSDTGRQWHLAFIVCSDDIEWCHANIPSQWRHQVAFVSTHAAAIDLAVLSKCSHTIVTVGTFGWWAAWLANGTTVYMKDWPTKGSYLDVNTNPEDYYPAGWLGL